jgi:hypothetical protein
MFRFSYSISVTDNHGYVPFFIVNVYAIENHGYVPFVLVNVYVTAQTLSKTNGTYP